MQFFTSSPEVVVGSGQRPGKRKEKKKKPHFLIRYLDSGGLSSCNVSTQVCRACIPIAWQHKSTQWQRRRNQFGCEFSLIPEECDAPGLIILHCMFFYKQPRNLLGHQDCFPFLIGYVDLGGLMNWWDTIFASLQKSLHD